MLRSSAQPCCLFFSSRLARASTLLQYCGKYALNSGEPAAREQHIAECRLRHERLAARARRQAQQSAMRG